MTLIMILTNFYLSIVNTRLSIFLRKSAQRFSCIIPFHSQLKLWNNYLVTSVPTEANLLWVYCPKWHRNSWSNNLTSNSQSPRTEFSITTLNYIFIFSILPIPGINNTWIHHLNDRDHFYVNDLQICLQSLAPS